MKQKYKKVYSLAHKEGYRNYTVQDLLKLKGKKKLTQVHVLTPEEAAAAEAAQTVLTSLSRGRGTNIARRVAGRHAVGCGTALRCCIYIYNSI